MRKPVAWLAALGGVAGGLVLASARVDSVRCADPPGSCPPDLATLAAPFVGRRMSEATCRELRTAVEGAWGVGEARVRRAWPSTLVVEVRRAAVLGRVGERGDAEVDAKGRLRPVSGSPDLPLIREWERAQGMPGFLATLEQVVATVSPSAGAEVWPGDGEVIVWVPRLRVHLRVPCPPDPGLGKRLAFVDAVVADMRARGERADTIDLRWSNQVVAVRSS